MPRARQDAHRPSVIIPDEYEYVGQQSMRIENAADCGVLAFERARIKRHMERTGGEYSRHEHGGSCHVCGAMAEYLVVFYHRPTNSYIHTGQDCAVKMEMGGDAAEFSAFRAAIKDHLAAVAGKKKAAAQLAEWGILEAVEAARTGDQSQFEERTIADLYRKLVAYGSLSERQISFLHKLLAQIPARAQLEADRAAERAAALPCPVGRAKVLGLVLATKNVESDWHRTGTLKMTVKDDRGFVCFGTVPLNIQDYDGQPLKGRRLEFTATLSPSSDDPKFGFFKRPTNCRLIKESAC